MKTGGTSTTVTVAVAVLIPPKPSLTVNVTVSVPTRRVGVGRLGPRRRPAVAERPGVGERIAAGVGRPRPSNGIAAPTLTVMLVNPMTAVGGMSTPNSCENSEVLPLGSVAVAVTNRAPPAGVGNWKMKLALPVASVVTDAEPRTYRPSP